VSGVLMSEAGRGAAANGGAAGTRQSAVPSGTAAGSSGGAGSAGSAAGVGGAGGSAPTPSIIASYTGSGATRGQRTAGDPVNIGREFHVTSSGITVHELGVWDEGADGLSTSHTVTLFSLDKTGTGARSSPVAGGSIVVPAGASAELADGFRFARLMAPINLMAGDYAIVAYGMNEQDPYGDNGNIPGQSHLNLMKHRSSQAFATRTGRPTLPSFADPESHTSPRFAV
jgi:hypothetical protein